MENLDPLAAPLGVPGAAEPSAAREDIHWTRLFDGAFLCWFALAGVFPHSSFLGLCLLGVGIVLLGSAFGRE
jgi:hypothetical protein